jgi:hypothetical protein
MSWMPIAAVAVAGTIATFTDWLFMGVLFHDRYFTHPEIWRPEFRTRGDATAILYSCALGYVTAAAVVGLCMLCGASGIEPALTIAVLAWIAGPLVGTVTNGIWIKIDPAVTFAHALGYLVRFLIAGLAAGIMLA